MAAVGVDSGNELAKARRREMITSCESHKIDSWGSQEARRKQSETRRRVGELYGISKASI